MTQDSEVQRSAPRPKDRDTAPGIRLAAAIAAIFGIIYWYWLMSGGANPSSPSADGTSELAVVKDQEMTAALTTMNGPNAFLAQFQKGKDGCRPPLAWVSLVLAPGQPPGNIRLISGDYVSPVFAVSTVPMRIAIPFPRPYETGNGTLTAIDIGGSTMIALLPAWHVSAQDGKVTRPVIWHPIKRCEQPNG
ncbi:hypothetical protein [Beijerinckia indica]|uniref:Uncharacterized protein n=1 Tax=Beijerinckia indica subsp. indica (strain ATCC 9039 / DSM 1715 / NCIMB 8712) TaxID=395963 RepID=B2IJZ1_BEII9|nr:hypothetical protein [Beijerinckia indica]ACB96366.1 hypothetical protein Bind_2797 [Beijerinckia indica subsp. indica ATCC 9039]